VGLRGRAAQLDSRPLAERRLAFLPWAIVVAGIASAVVPLVWYYEPGFDGFTVALLGWQLLQVVVTAAMIAIQVAVAVSDSGDGQDALVFLFIPFYLALGVVAYWGVFAAAIGIKRRSRKAASRPE
jgi:hypothetical protein